MQAGPLEQIKTAAQSRLVNLHDERKRSCVQTTYMLRLGSFVTLWLQAMNGEMRGVVAKTKRSMKELSAGEAEDLKDVAKMGLSGKTPPPKKPRNHRRLHTWQEHVWIRDTY